jgi:diacylglycerol kinase family enzyme
MTRRRLLAVVALLLLALGFVAAAVITVDQFPRGLLVAALAAGLVAAAWWAAVHIGVRRWAGLAFGAALFVALVAVLASSDAPIPGVAVLAAVVLALAAARAAFTAPADLPRAPRPEHAVVFWNPKSGGGKAERARVDEEAHERGIEAVQLRPGDDLRELVKAAVEGGADALAAAGGDGTQAIVATAAAEHGLPYACIPAGTRNHFALDLGVDRDDVVGALDALTDGRERRVDLAEVNGRVFVNNVSLGVYAEAVQRQGYREAKLRTISEALPETLGPNGAPPDLHWTGPDGREHRTGAVLLISNNPYRLRAVGAGTRPRMDTGELGVAVFEPGGRRADREGRGPLSQWSTPTFDVRSAHGVPAGLDGEAVTLEPPVHFSSRRAALTVLIAPHHPGASPSAGLPTSAHELVPKLVQIALGRSS